ncbi:MAG TPA: phosphoribosylglycinamide formyltransferase [Nevskiaceae bacterium]|nr:phosphoribosylglycinamide formyltransferase [Nevskiaceae bacterium]
MKRARLAVLVSGRGRNLQALQAACADGRIAADPVLVISNDASAAALAFAREREIPAIALPHGEFSSRTDFDSALGQNLRRVKPDIVALTGFMRILGSELVAEFTGRMLNIHPSLLPKYPGLHTHRRALAAHDAQHGATVHFVTPELDGGPRVLQGAVAVAADDDEARLAARVLQQVELKIYPQVVAWLARGELSFAQGQALWHSRPLTQPLTLTDLEEAFR